MTQADIPGPLTGAYYWFPRPVPGGLAWELVTCHDLGVWDGISHRGFWPYVLEHLAAAWGKDDKVLERRLRDSHAGLPRGRVTHPKSGYAIIHGDDAPVASWLELVKARFRLTEVIATPEFTEHEGMIIDDLRALQEALGISFDGKRTV
jgi:hypothetical protein